MKFIILPILGVFAFRTSGVSADCCKTTIQSPCSYLFKGYTFHSLCKAGAGPSECNVPGNDYTNGFIVCGTNGTNTNCGTFYSDMRTCVPTPTPPTQTSPKPNPSNKNTSTPTPLTKNSPTTTPPTKNPPTPTPPTPTPPTPNLLGDTPSSAGKIGMGYVWFVAAAAAFAGIN